MRIIQDSQGYRVIWHGREDQDNFHALKKICHTETEAEVYAQKLRDVIHSGYVEPSDRAEVISALRTAFQLGISINPNAMGKPKFKLNQKKLADSTPKFRLRRKKAEETHQREAVEEYETSGFDLSFADPETA